MDSNGGTSPELSASSRKRRVGLGSRPTEVQIQPKSVRMQGVIWNDDQELAGPNTIEAHSVIKEEISTCETNPSNSSRGQKIKSELEK